MFANNFSDSGEKECRTPNIKSFLLILVSVALAAFAITYFCARFKPIDKSAAEKLLEDKYSADFEIAERQSVSINQAVYTAYPSDYPEAGFRVKIYYVFNPANIKITDNYDAALWYHVSGEILEEYGIQPDIKQTSETEYTEIRVEKPPYNDDMRKYCFEFETQENFDKQFEALSALYHKLSECDFFGDYRCVHVCLLKNGEIIDSSPLNLYLKKHYSDEQLSELLEYRIEQCLKYHSEDSVQ